MSAPEKKTPAWVNDSTPCPSWCPYGRDHKDSDAYDDRTHSGSTWHVPLTAEDPIAYAEGPGGERVVDSEPSELDLYLVMHYREIEPRIWLGRDGTDKGQHLTLKEARELAERLTELVRQGSGD